MKRLNDYMMTELIGANNNHVVPSTPQSWAEYSDPKSRWTTRKGLFGVRLKVVPIETGEIPPGNQNTVGFRTYKSVFDLGPAAEKYTVKMSGCHSCPIRCMTQMNIPRVKSLACLAPVVTLVWQTLSIPPSSQTGRKILKIKTMVV